MDAVLKYFAMITHHMGLLSKSSVAHLTHEGLLSGVDFKMLLEIESLGVYQQTTDWAALVVRPEERQEVNNHVSMSLSLDSPVIVHVDVEVVQTGQHCVALDAVYGPHVVLDLVLVLAHGGVARPRLGLGGAEGRLGGGHRGLGQVVQGELVAAMASVTPGVGLGLGAQPRREDSRHLRLLLLDEAAEAEGEAEVGEHGGIVQGRVQRLELDCVGWPWLRLLLTTARRKECKKK